MGLNFSVRNGKRCFPLAKATGNFAAGGEPPTGTGLSPGPENCTADLKQKSSSNKYPSSPRPISTGLLSTLLCLHIRPINLVVYQGPYSLKGMGELISRWASRLDAFSGYPVQT